MSHSDWDTKTVAESVGSRETNWKCEHDDGVICIVCFSLARRDRGEALMKLDKLEAQAAGMRNCIQGMLASVEKELRKEHHGKCYGWSICGPDSIVPKFRDALSGDAGKELLKELEQLRVVVDSEHWKLLRLERDEARADLDREQKKNLQERKDLSELYGSNMQVLRKMLAEVNEGRDEARANMEVLKSQLAELNRQLAEERGINRNRKIADREQYQMVVDQRTEERDAARRDCEDLQRQWSRLNDDLLQSGLKVSELGVKLAEKEKQLETAQKELAEIKDGPPLKQIIEAEVSRAVDVEREACAQAAENQCGCCCSENIQEAIRARGNESAKQVRERLGFSQVSDEQQKQNLETNLDSLGRGKG